MASKEHSPIVPGSTITYQEFCDHVKANARWFDDYMADLERHRQIIAATPCPCCRCPEDN